MSFQLFDDDGKPADPEVLHKALLEWTGYDVMFKSMQDVGAEMKIKEQQMEAARLALASNMTAFLGIMFEATQKLTTIGFTPYFTVQGIIGLVMEFMFSAMIAERRQLGQEINGPQMQEEFSQTCYQHMMAVMNDVADKVNTGTFKLRITSTTDAMTNAPSTVTRQ